MAAALAAAAVASLVAGCSKDDGGSADKTTTTEAVGPPTDAESQRQAFDADERVLSTIRLPGAVGMFAKSDKECPAGQSPRITRVDQSSLAPDEVKTQLASTLEDLGWTHEDPANGTEQYRNDPFRLEVTLAASDGGTKATLVVTSDMAGCL